MCRSLSPSDSGPGSHRLIRNISSPTSAGMLRRRALTRTSRLGVTPGPVPPCHGRRRPDSEGASAATVTVPAARVPGPGGSGRATVTVTVTDSDRACQAAAESLTVTVRHRPPTVGPSRSGVRVTVRVGRSPAPRLLGPGPCVTSHGRSHCDIRAAPLIYTLSLRPQRHWQAPGRPGPGQAPATGAAAVLARRAVRTRNQGMAIPSPGHRV